MIPFRRTWRLPILSMSFSTAWPWILSTIFFVLSRWPMPWAICIFRAVFARSSSFIFMISRILPFFLIYFLLLFLCYWIWLSLLKLLRKRNRWVLIKMMIITLVSSWWWSVWSTFSQMRSLMIWRGMASHWRRKSIIRIQRGWSRVWGGYSSKRSLVIKNWSNLLMMIRRRP